MALLVDPRAATVALDHGALVIAAHRAGFLAHVLGVVTLVGEEVFVVGGQEDVGDVARGGDVGAVLAHLAENLEHVEVLAGVLEGDETAALAACAVQAVRVEGDVRVRERRVELRLEEAAADARRGAREGEERVEERGLVVGFLVRGCLGRRTVARNRHRDGGGAARGTARTTETPTTRVRELRATTRCSVKRARHDDARVEGNASRKNPRRAADTSQGTRTQCARGAVYSPGTVTTVPSVVIRRRNTRRRDT